MTDNEIKWHSESWMHKGKYFTVEIEHWQRKCIDDNDFDKEFIGNFWNVYAHIFPKHPIFEELKNDELFLDHGITGYFHCGLSYHKWIADKNGEVEVKRLGSDYMHLHDNYKRVSDINQTPTMRDAKDLIEYLENYQRLNND
jgi:hypothetical protein